MLFPFCIVPFSLANDSDSRPTVPMVRGFAVPEYDVDG